MVLPEQVVRTSVYGFGGDSSSDVVPGLTAVAAICGAGGSCGTCSLVGVCSTAS